MTDREASAPGADPPCWFDPRGVVRWGVTPSAQDQQDAAELLPEIRAILRETPPNLVTFIRKWHGPRGDGGAA